MIRSNYKFQKRKKELARKEKKELKRQRKTNQKFIESQTIEACGKEATEPPEII